MYIDGYLIITTFLKFQFKFKCSLCLLNNFEIKFIIIENRYISKFYFYCLSTDLSLLKFRKSIAYSKDPFNIFVSVSF